ncbi:carbamate kinase [candidate division WOR-3 bacterium]|uniref:Carbamate kinase n=1 Tax=candidate division WOR-3 bacterium TaxID=2052148 RepID=A0A660SJ05_UNCW3|nr:MAG: carbamate kinase [candidate division WOR-3 bacterium]
MGEICVVALGGNAIARTGKEDIHQQFANTRKSLSTIVDLIRDGYDLVITHGNGPQVGNALLRVERTMDVIPPLPLGVIVADTEGGMGYMIEQSLQNRLRKEGIPRRVVTVITQVIVDHDDPALKRPSKPVGPFYTKEQAELLARKFNWVIKEDSGRGYRRVVSSPIPRSVVNSDIIKRLVEDHIIVIAAGGGGIPVYVETNGDLEGIDAVIDKDLASAVLGIEIGATYLIILTNVEHVMLNYGKPDARILTEITVQEAQDYLEDGHFPPGSMGPKIEAAIEFIKGGGRMVVITSIDKGSEALKGKTGTRIIR